MKRNSRLLGLATLVCLFVGQTDLYAQQEPGYTQYMYNTNLINPAYAGTRGVLSVFGQYRAQWVGYDGAPQTAAISVSTPLGNSKLGLGVNYINDRIGATDNNTLQVDLSYTVDLNENYKLAFGLKGTANLMSVDYTKLDIFDPLDPNLQNNINNHFTGNIGAGAYLFSDKSYLGFSIPTFLNSKYTNEEKLSLMEKKMNLYLMGGHVFTLSDNIDFKPAFLVKAVSGAPVDVDLSANFLFNKKFTAGVAYRFDSAVSGLVGFQINQGLFIGYSYDMSTNKMIHYNSGSHEIMLRFDFFEALKKFSSPRFF